MYSATGRDTVDFPYLHQQIFEEKGDIDIAIMSSSRLGCAIDAHYLQKRLSDKLGRPAVVRSLTWTWNGYDALYFIAQDLLQHRRVHMIVLCDLSSGATDIAHHQTSSWFRWADNAGAMKLLPLESRASFYASAILGLPRNLVGLLRSNLPPLPADKDKPAWNHSPTDFTPVTTAGPADVLVYSGSQDTNFKFPPTPITRMQMVFVHNIGVLAQEHQTRLVFLHIPDYADRRQSEIVETIFWPAAFGINLDLVGIPPAVLFAGLTDDEIGKLYFNPTHFNQNGKNYFTPIITPALIQIYEDQTKP